MTDYRVRSDNQHNKASSNKYKVIGQIAVLMTDVACRNMLHMGRESIDMVAYALAFILSALNLHPLLHCTHG